MKKEFKKFLAGTVACSLIACTGVSATESKAEEIKIDETTMSSQILTFARQADSNQDGILSDDEAKKVEYLSFYEETADITEALKLFPNVNRVYINAGKNKAVIVNNTKIKEISVSGNDVTALKGASPKKVYVSVKKSKGNLKFTGVDGYAKVEEFLLTGAGKASKVSVPNAAKVKKVGISNCGLTKIDLSKFKNATEITLDNNKLKTINLKKNTKLTSLSCYSNKLTKLNISANKKLKDFGVGGNNLKAIDITKNKKLQRVVAFDNKIQKIASKKSTVLREMNLSDNKFSSLDVSKYPNLAYLFLNNNKLKKLDVKKNTKIRGLYCAGNPISTISLNKMKDLGSLDLSGTLLKKISLAKNVSLSYVSVGYRHALLKNVKLSNKYPTIIMKVKYNKTYNLSKLIPALKGYKFTIYGSPATVSGSGVLKTKTLKKSSYQFVNAQKGTKSVSIRIGG